MGEIFGRTPSLEEASFVVTTVHQKIMVA